MRFEVLAAAWQTGASNSGHYDSKQCAQIYHSSAKSSGYHFIEIQIEPTNADAMRLEGKDHEWHWEHGLSPLLVLSL